MIQPSRDRRLGANPLAYVGYLELDRPTATAGKVLHQFKRGEIATLVPIGQGV